MPFSMHAACLAAVLLTVCAATATAQMAGNSPITSANNVPMGLAPSPAGAAPYLGNSSFAVAIENPGNACPITSGSATAVLFAALPAFPVPQLPAFGCQPGQPGDVLLDLSGYLGTAFGPLWTGPGTAQVPLPIPMDSALFGAALALQGLFVDPVGPTGVALTEGLFLFLGNDPNATPPINDACAGAIALSNGTTPGTNVGATRSPPFLSCTKPGGFAGSMVWYSYTASCTGTAVVSMCPIGAADFDAMLAAFGGTCGSLTQLACNDDACGLRPEISFPATQGTTYFIVVAGFNTMQGSFSLTVTCQ